MPFSLAPLPYEKGALAPHISEQTLEYHYGEHHKGYVDKLNRLIEGGLFGKASLAEIIRETAGDEAEQTIFNNAAQVWNHTFYWNSMKPSGGGAPKGDFARALDRDLGGVEGFNEAFSKAAAEQFGSGYAWLTLTGGRLVVVKAPNAENPLTSGAARLLTLDVWEHAYYLDPQNREPEYIAAFLDHLINWDFAEANLARA
jgi:Fe-Mn family superoxide dismutase